MNFPLPLKEHGITRLQAGVGTQTGVGLFHFLLTFAVSYLPIDKLLAKVRKS